MEVISELFRSSKRSFRSLDGFSIPFFFYVGRQQKGQKTKSYASSYQSIPGAFLSIMMNLLLLTFTIYLVTEMYSNDDDYFIIQKILNNHE